MKCKICNSPSKIIFNAKVLIKYDVDYSKCENCGFIQTGQVFWLDEAYSNAITSLDIGLLFRNFEFKSKVLKIIHQFFNKDSIFLDYAGGYGVFVRLMRDAGIDFYRQDIYCENIFAKHFDITDIDKKNDFELVTAFEVFEHFDNPLKEIEEIFKYSKNVLFSTAIIPNKEIKSSDDWEYFAPETGQHISFFTLKSLDFIAKRFNKHFYTNKYNLHLFSDKKLELNPFSKNYFSLKSIIFKFKYRFFNKHKTLLQNDSEMIKNNFLF